eukprot:gene22635-27326_t
MQPSGWDPAAGCTGAILQVESLLGSVVRDVATAIRPMLKVDTIVPLQRILDEVRHKLKPEIRCLGGQAQMQLKSSQSMLVKFRNIAKLVRRKGNRMMREVWTGWLQQVIRSKEEEERLFSSQRLLTLYYKVMSRCLRGSVQLWHKKAKNERCDRLERAMANKRARENEAKIGKLEEKNQFLQQEIQHEEQKVQELEKEIIAREKDAEENLRQADIQAKKDIVAAQRRVREEYEELCKQL